MTVDLEEQLCTAYDAVPAEATDASRLAAQARSAGGRRRRLRTTAGVGGGLVAATAIVASVALAGSAFGSGSGQPQHLAPAATGAVLSSPARPVPTVTPGHDDYSGPGGSDSSALGHNKKVAGLAGYLLPHNAQLPQGLSYANRKASTSDGYDQGQAVVPLLVAARSNLHNDESKDTTGIVGSVSDTAFNYRADGTLAGDGNPDQRSLDSQIIAYKTVNQARSAVATVQANRGGWVWYNRNGAVRLPWAGIPRADGPSYLYKMPPMGIKDRPDLKFQGTYIAVQIVGKYALAASSNSQQRSSAALTSMITNLKNANLL